jgi:hypothetical protein
MLKQLLATTALVAGLSVTAWAEDPAQPEAADPAAQPPAAEADMNSGAATEELSQPEAQAVEPEDTIGDQADEATGAQPEESEEAQPELSTAPTSEPAIETTEVGRSTPDQAVITTQPDSSLLAADIIGMTVVSAEGEDIGEVDDLIFDDQQRLSGVVVGVGGFLGIGEKSVGIDWSQAEVRTDPESGSERIFVSMTKADLEAAPDFKTQAELRAEAEAAAAQQQLEMQSQTPPATTQ